MEVKTYGAEITKILDLMINALYTNGDIFLRELISNASDACDKLRYLSLQDASLMQTPHEFKITIKIDKDNGILSIIDNGIGMDKEDLIKNLGTIASSGTQKFLESLNQKSDINLIGQFGVGFYSAFIVASEVTVISKKAGTEQAYIWRSAGKGEYEVGEYEGDASIGTQITLKVKPEEVKYLDKFNLEHIITTYSDHIAFPIELIDNQEKGEIVNNASALWVRNKNDITEEQYNEFYHHVAHQPDTPWLRLHHKVEGNIEYTSLLYIPSTKPFDLFHPDRKTRVKLYIKRVFITEDTTNLIPQYLRFLRGIIDSEDLPLNISRETIQNNAIIKKIRQSLVKKVLTELKSKAQSDPSEYEKFWRNFGEVLKEGLCEHVAEEKELLLEICRFYSSKDENLISLDQYIDRMAEGQDTIFFVTGDNIDKLKSHPNLEGFKQRNIEVLLLADYVDDFWVNVIPQYKNKELKNISVSDIDLDKINSKKEEVQEEPQENTEKLIAFLKEELGDNVKEVKITTKLVNSAACLAIPEGYMSFRMEKLLIEQKQLKTTAAKVLEVNPKHILIKKLIASLENGNTEKAKELGWLAFDQACILEGEQLIDTNKFLNRLNKLIEAA